VNDFTRMAAAAQNAQKLSI